MGVDYRGVGGIGICITEEDEEAVREFAGIYASDHDVDLDTDGNFGELIDELIDELSHEFDLDLKYSEAGYANYSGDPTWYLHVPGNTLDELSKNAWQFLEAMQRIGLKKTRADLKVIEDLHVY